MILINGEQSLYGQVSLGCTSRLGRFRIFANDGLRPILLKKSELRRGRISAKQLALQEWHADITYSLTRGSLSRHRVSPVSLRIENQLTPLKGLRFFVLAGSTAQAGAQAQGGAGCLGAAKRRTHSPVAVAQNPHVGSQIIRRRTLGSNEQI